jgi:hypothetical protein
MNRRESDPVAVEGLLVFRPDPLDVLGRCDSADAARIRNIVHLEGAYLHGPTHRARLSRVRFEPVECAFRPIFGLELDERTNDVRRGLCMRRSEEAGVHTRSLEPGLLEDRGEMESTWAQQLGPGRFAELRELLLELNQAT